MRTNIEIDDELLWQAMKIAGTSTKKETVDRALRSLVQAHSRSGFEKLLGKVKFRADYDYKADRLHD